MNMNILLISAVGGYLLGSISSARVITRLFAGDKKVPEVTELSIEGSDKKMSIKTISATSVSTNVGAKYGFLTYLSDVLKVFIPVMFLKTYYPDTHYFLVTAATGVIGHIWPIYHKFKGGRGISAIYGGLFAIDWIAVFVAAIGGMLFGLVVLRDLYFAYMAGLWLLLPWLWFRTHDIFYIIYLLTVNILFLISSLPESREWYRIKKEEHWKNPDEAFQISAMGRGIIKMLKKIGFYKPRS